MEAVFRETAGQIPQLLRSQVYEHLRNQLKKGTLKPGMFISMNQLMKTLGMSRTPLRDALLQLQFEGFVTFLPQRGIKINALNRRDIEDIYEMIGGLDSAALLSVFDRIGPAQIREMKRINQEMYNHIEQAPFHRYWQLNTAFHGVYLGMSANTPLLNQLNILRQRLLEFGKKDWDPEMRHNNYSEHIRLVELIERKNPVRAADFIRDVHCMINFEI